jgi:trimeric autotransporter adhesin
MGWANLVFGDGVIDTQDAVYKKLVLWWDMNHDGVSQPTELLTLSSQGLTSIRLDYKTVGRQAQYGNSSAINLRSTALVDAGHTMYF